MKTSTLTCALVAACMAGGAANVMAADGRVPVIAQIEARVAGKDLVVTARYAERTTMHGAYEADRDGSWACQLLLDTGAGGYVVDGQQYRDGVAPVLEMGVEPFSSAPISRLKGDARIHVEPVSLTLRVPLAALGNCVGAMNYRLQLYAMTALGPEYGGLVRGEYVTEYAGCTEAPDRRARLLSTGASDTPAAVASTSWGGLKALYRP